MMGEDTILIWDLDTSPNKSNAHVAYWQSYSVLSLDNEISVPQLVEEQAEFLKSRYLTIIYELGETKFNGKSLVDNLEVDPGFSYWWMSLFNEKCNNRS